MIFNFLNLFTSMFVERQACYSALFTFLVEQHTGAVSLPPGDVILAQLACPPNNIIFCLHQDYISLQTLGYLFRYDLYYLIYVIFIWVLLPQSRMLILLAKKYELMTRTTTQQSHLSFWMFQSTLEEEQSMAYLGPVL